jgi:guanylate kinase
VGFTVYCDDADAARAELAANGATAAGTVTRTEIHVGGPMSEAWFEERPDTDGGPIMVVTERPTQPGRRVAFSEVTELDPGAPGADFGAGREVTVRREIWTANAWQARIEHVDGVADFLRIDVPVDAHDDTDEAVVAANRLADLFGITAANVLPWSYGELAAMYRSAHHFRSLLDSTGNASRLVLLDGASGTGKTTIFRTLTAIAGAGMAGVPRYSTRETRGDGEHAEYIFVSPEEFRKATDEGAFIESRDFLFGMSYGLPWREAFDPLLAGRDALGIIDYGNAGHVRRILPEALLVLVEASPDTLRRRLAQRGTNTDEQIEERLTNAVALASPPETYDLIVRNEDGELDTAVAAIGALLGGETGP